jgi:hypothetical protein
LLVDARKHETTLGDAHHAEHLDEAALSGNVGQLVSAKA